MADPKNDGDSITVENVIATESTLVHDDALGIDRQIIAGQPVPPDLVDAYKGVVGDKAEDKDPGAAARSKARSK